MNSDCFRTPTNRARFDCARGHETTDANGAQRGRMAELAEQTVVINDTHYGRVEDVQMGICHLLCYAFMEHPDWAK